MKYEGVLVHSRSVQCQLGLGSCLIVLSYFFWLFAVSSYVALLYDIALTMASEYDLIWSTRLTWASLLYALMRYGSLIWQGISLALHICSDAPNVVSLLSH
ncbi:hypothetical protein L218DRAFT_496596 [Marasmius fiardii PR-910]|nr:hypothetical protein L218DRAFT_496596 [Marasmius fiardii PR-910]